MSSPSKFTWVTVTKNRTYLMIGSTVGGAVRDRAVAIARDALVMANACRGTVNPGCATAVDEVLEMTLLEVSTDDVIEGVFVPVEGICTGKDTPFGWACGPQNGQGSSS
jgi:hypothetical protein